MKLAKTEIIQAQVALLAAIVLQVVVWNINKEMLWGFHYGIVVVELILAVTLGFTAGVKSVHGRALQHGAATVLIGAVTIANFASLTAVVNTLIAGQITDGALLLGSAVAIFFTNVIVYALWYWEIDSPGLTNHRWTKNDKDFQFTQYNLPHEFPNWKPEFVDYLYISVINSLNGANTGAQALTKQAKILMATQAIVSIFTLALVVARSVGILGT